MSAGLPGCCEGRKVEVKQEGRWMQHRQSIPGRLCEGRNVECQGPVCVCVCVRGSGGERRRGAGRRSEQSAGEGCKAGGRGTSVWNLRMASVTYGINFCSGEGYTSVFILLQNSLDWDSHHCCQGWIASESSHRRNCTAPSFSAQNNSSCNSAGACAL